MTGEAESKQTVRGEKDEGDFGQFCWKEV